MRHSHPRRWQIGRLVRSAKPVVHPESRILRMNIHPEPLPNRPEVPLALRQEAPGADGIRHALVAHIKQLIADGAYDTPERWEIAEERLFRRINNLDD